MGTPKIEEKTWISREGQCKKNGKFQGVNMTGNSGGSTSKKSISSRGGGTIFFSGKANFFFKFHDSTDVYQEIDK